jgi:hypothetical protein
MSDGPEESALPAGLVPQEEFESPAKFGWAPELELRRAAKSAQRAGECPVAALHWAAVAAVLEAGRGRQRASTPPQKLKRRARQTQSCAGNRSPRHERIAKFRGPNAHTLPLRALDSTEIRRPTHRTERASERLR